MTAVLDVPFALIFVFALFLINPVLAFIVAGFLIAVFIAAMLSLASLRNSTKD